MNTNEQCCPSCGAGNLSSIYRVEGVPVHSVILHHSLQEAIDYPKGDIDLGFCKACGFITNSAFDPDVHEYDAEYESTQAFSPTFNSFHRTLAEDLVERYQLRGKKIVEIGCGQGEFLKLLCETGKNTGIGFDPAYIGTPFIQNPDYEITFIPDFYSEEYANYQGDFFCCKMTLEHIHDTQNFVKTVRRVIGEQTDTVVFFQVPNARYVFGDIAFWDIYYEHCSYFTAGSLARLFRSSGFDVMDLWTGYDDQYIMIEAKPSYSPSRNSIPQEEPLAAFTQEISRFKETVPTKIKVWKEFFEDAKNKDRKVVMWGGGSKCVAFLTTIGLSQDEVAAVVDINPRKNNTYLAGSGHKVILPEYLKQVMPDIVVVMNPVYRDEIHDQLKQMDLNPQTLTIQDC